MRPTFDLTGDSSWTTAATIRSLENEWQAAIKGHDVAALDRLLADDFSATSSTGREGNKATVLAEMRNDRSVYDSARAQGMKIRSLGPDAAVVTGTATESGTTSDGQRFKTSRRFTDKWERRNGRWQCVASKATRLPGQ
ncbi:MAG: nuclear transport factor 2 family protein [Chthoniobacterales bacterium]|nr:nuclear transport factor 2 family protein [Chthoniobacterales bacterium]